MSKKLTNEEIDLRLVGQTIKRKGDYIDMHTNIEFECLIDGYIWLARPNNIIHGHKCPKCNNCVPHSNETIDAYLVGKNIIRIGNFIKNTHKSKIEFECLIDHHRWFASVDNIFHGYGCPKCGNRIPSKSNEILDFLLKDRNIKRIGDYKSDSTKIEFECLLDHHRWFATPRNILVGRGCPLCAFGKSERKCLDLIKQLCKYDALVYHKCIYLNNKRYLPDFYLEISGNTIIIEYNGVQHYQPVRFNGITQEKAELNFEKQKVRDETIRKYCRENSIYLLEIPWFWEKDKVTFELNKLNETFKYALPI